MKGQSLRYFTRIQELMADRTPFVSVTLVQIRGSAPQDLGAKCLVTKEGLFEGTVGGGKLEAKCIAKAGEMLGSAEAPTHEFVNWNLQRDVGMTCGGEVSLFFEVFFCKEWEIAVFGAGHVAQALIRLLLTLDCRVTCIDQRQEWLDKLPDSPQLTKVRNEDLAAEVPRLPENAYVMLMTQGHAHDMPILIELLRTRRPPYFGVIGSQVKSIKVRKELRDAGIPADIVEELRCPMGLPFGSNAPAEIAISMVAEILTRRG